MFEATHEGADLGGDWFGGDAGSGDDRFLKARSGDDGTQRIISVHDANGLGSGDLTVTITFAAEH